MSVREDEQANPAVIEATAPYVRALGRHEDSPNGRAALALLGESPAVTELVVGAPAVTERYLVFPFGAEVLVRDGIIAAFWFHVAPDGALAGGYDPARLLPGVPVDAGWDAVKAVAGSPRRFAFTGSSDAFAVRDASLYVTLRPAEGGHRGVEVISLRPAVIDRALRALENRCRVCLDVAVCDEGGAMVLDATLDRLAERVVDGRLTEDPYRVRLADVRDLRASGLVEQVEAHLDCSTCRTTWCLTLPLTGEPTLTDVAGFAHQHPRIAVPPLELWAGAGRRAAANDALRVVDWSRGAWFLMQKHDELYLDARVSAGFVDTSVLIRLSDAERAAREREGHGYVDGLAARINDAGPSRDRSPWFERDLSRGQENRAINDEARAAIGAWLQQVEWRPDEGNVGE